MGFGTIVIGSYMTGNTMVELVFTINGFSF